MIWVGLADTMPAGWPLNFTVSFPGMELKWLPVIVTCAPTVSVSGVKLLIVGAGMVKMAADVAVWLPTVTVILPDSALVGTTTVNWLQKADTTTAVTPLNLTVSFWGLLLKPVPLIVTCAPMVSV